MHKKMTWLETFNEVIEIFLLYHMNMFTQWIADPKVRYQVGWSFIAVICGYMMLHLSMMIRTSCKNMIDKCKRNKLRKAS